MKYFINNISIKTKFLIAVIIVFAFSTSMIIGIRVVQLQEQQRTLIIERLQGNTNLALGILQTVKDYTERILDIVATMPYVEDTLSGDEQAYENLKKRLLSFYLSINQEEDDIYVYENIMV